MTLDQIAELNLQIGQRTVTDVFFVRDLVLVPIYLFLIYLFLKSKRKSQPLEIQKYYIPAYFSRIFGLGFYLLFFLLAYGGGDTFTYFDDMNRMYKLAGVDINYFIKLINGSISLSNNGYSFSTFIFKEEGFLIKLCGLVNIFCFNSYLVTSLVIGLFSFGGLWAIFKTIYSVYPHLKKPLAVAILFVPTVILWSSAISKEIICIGAMGYWFQASWDLIILKQKRILNIIVILICSFLLIKIKVYILLALVCALAFMIVGSVIKFIKSPIAKFLAYPIILFAMMFIILFAYQSLGDSLKSYSTETILQNVVRTSNYLSQESRSGSSYNIGKISRDMTFVDVLKLAPAGVVVSLFRPYIWEIKNVGILIASFESIITLLLTLFVFLKSGIVKSFKLVFTEPLIIFCFVFVVVFGIAVGVTSGNFGTLMRYKSPLMPYYFTMLVLIYSISQGIRNEKKKL
jgi:hypothetical protein